MLKIFQNVFGVYRDEGKRIKYQYFAQNLFGDNLYIKICITSDYNNISFAEIPSQVFFF